MLKGLGKIFSTKKVIVFLVILLLAFGLLGYSSGKGSILDGMDPSPAPTTEIGVATTAAPVHDNLLPTMPSAASASITNPSDLLPTDSNSSWAALNPSSMASGDMVDATKLYGESTSISHFNPNLSLRADPVIPMGPGPLTHQPRDTFVDKFRSGFEITKGSDGSF